MGLAAGQQGGAQGPDSGQQQSGGASGQISTLPAGDQTSNSGGGQSSN